MIIAGTGHRPDKLGGYTGETYWRLYNLAHDYLTQHTPDRIITGMALGWDTVLAHVARDLTIPFIAAIPFAGQESRWPHASQVFYRELLNHAHHVKVVCEGGYAAWKMQVRNKWMVDECDKLIALWNGTPGGTANCIRYAQTLSRPLRNLWPEWEAICRIPATMVLPMSTFTPEEQPSSVSS
jgi:uncharacterized phage-like protein YoqJ